MSARICDDCGKRPAEFGAKRWTFRRSLLCLECALWARFEVVRLAPPALEPVPTGPEWRVR